jgi:microcystin-dependent protein
VERPGFVIPNAGDATKSTLIAEPDAGDYHILGNHEYGVFLGCDYILNGPLFSLISPVNVFTVAGEVYVTRNDTSSVRIDGTDVSANQTRFDLIGYRIVNGVPRLSIEHGPYGIDRPVFPEVPDDMVIFASVYVPAAMTSWAGVTDVAEYVTDKRLMLLSGAKGVAGPTDNFVEVTNPDDGSTTFSIRGDGSMFFANGATIKQNGTRALRISETLFADNLAGLNLNITNDGDFGGIVSAANLVQGDGPPTSSTKGNIGTLYQDTLNGHVWLKNGIGQWDMLTPDGYPAGTIMPSVLPSDHPWLGGVWLLCDGRTVTQAQAGMLWTLMPQWQVPNNRFVLPDLRQRVLVGADAAQGVGQVGGSNDYTLGDDHLPLHDHDVTVGQAGGHHHGLVTADAGGHVHPLLDPGHNHFPNWWPTPNTQFINVEWGGPFGLLGRWQALYLTQDYINRHGTPPNWDAGTAVGQNPATMTAVTGITMQGVLDHHHSGNTDDQSAHIHPVAVQPTGVQSQIDNRQKFMTINFFIKAS